MAESYRIPASSDSRMPVARTTAMTAAPRRWANARPWRARSSLDRSTLVNTGGELAGDLRRAQPGHRVRPFFPGPDESTTG